MQTPKGFVDNEGLLSLVAGYRNRIIFVLTVNTLLLCASYNFAGNIKVRVDETGRKTFYNIPSRALDGGGAGYAVYYSQRANDYAPYIQQASFQYGVNSELIRAVIQVESAYNPYAVSPKGARGLMQLMPDTAVRYGVRSIFDPQQNIQGGVKYLRDLLNLFSGNLELTIAAYNAGEGVVSRLNDIPDYQETQNYVRMVMALYNGDASYTPYNGPLRRAVYYKYTDDKGVTHYSLEPATGPNVVKINFAY
ncbi:MAG: hypothetical protein C5B54_04200 [Acidobacteria bacterium]|nr:MAG: hypothetical protein C5B54_04200 [Acidobacteriota bacterium]